jgi:hypothetical protein
MLVPCRIALLPTGVSTARPDLTGHHPVIRGRTNGRWSTGRQRAGSQPTVPWRAVAWRAVVQPTVRAPTAEQGLPTT